MKTSRPVENKTLAIALLQNHARNYNRHSDSQIADLRASLQQFGQVRSVVVQANGGKAYTILAGHGIIEAAKQEGYTELRADVVPASWAKTKALAYLAADNELARRGDPDQDQLAAIVQEVMDAEGEALARLAAGEQGALDALLARANPKEETADVGELIDKAAELQKKWRVEKGDIWHCGNQRIICGDSTDAHTVSALMGNDTARMVWTDPPYGVNYGDKLDAANPIMHRVRHIKNDNLSDDELESLIRSALLNAADNCVKGAAVYVACPQGKQLPVLIKAFSGSGFEFRWHLVWIKDQMVLGRGDYHFKHENILYGWKQDGAHYFTDDRKQTSVFEFARPKRSDEHPTMKPPELIAAMINNSSRAGDVVLDTFVGSGSTLIACEMTGRKGRGVELTEAFTSVSLERLSLLGLTPKRIEQAGHGTQKIGTNTEKTGRQKGHKPQQSRQSETAVAAGRSVA